ncbi:MAG: hypothetical protein JWQ87_1684 [Candidatus Sulfotelmatobacter sp.]|nr:hypothetical protein [Candidatus Sulfotelmatobacter sp.]
MPNETLRYYATDKEIFDVLASSRQRVSETALLDMARSRGIFYSPRDSRDTLASNISLLPHDHDSLKEILGKSENPNRAEKVTSITLNAKISPETIKAVVKSFSENAPSDEKVVAQSESPDKYRVQVKYTELDYAKTRLLQRRNREADIRFIIEDNKTTIRLPANPKAREIAALLKSGLDASQKTEIPAETIDISDLSADERTLFFTNLISTMDGYELRDVMNVKVQIGSASKSPPLEDEEKNGEEHEDVAITQTMLSVVEDVALHGKALLVSAEYQLLKDKGFFITSITWKAQQTKSPFNIVEYDAGFEEPEEGRGFRYNVRGLYRNRDGEFTKTIQALSAAHKEEIFPIIERTALRVLVALRKKADVPQQGGEQQ